MNWDENLDKMNHWVSSYINMPDWLTNLLIVLGLALTAHLFLRFLFRRLRKLARESTKLRWDDVAVDAAEPPVRTLVWLVAAYVAMQFVFTRFSEDVSAFVERAYDTGLILMVLWFLRRLIYGVEASMLADDAANRGSTDRAAISATAKLARIVLWVVAGLMILQSMNVSVSGLLAFGGVGGIAVGFAAKDMLANFFGALVIYFDRPFTVGDWIRSPDKEIEGTVEDIGWRLTRIRTFDQRPLYVPNSLFTQISVENPSRMFNRRIYETVGIRYEDADKMAAIVSDVHAMLKAHPEIDLNRTLIVNFVSFGPSSLDFFVYAFTRTTLWVRFHEIKQDILLKILAIVHKHDADVAFPTRTVMLQSPEPEPEKGIAEPPGA